MKSATLKMIAILLGFVLFVNIACNRKKSSSEPVGAKESQPVLVARGAPAGPVTKAMIGASGGSLKSSDGRLAISIPPGAVMADTAVSIQPLIDTEGIAVGPVYELSPEGTNFAQPVTLSWQLSDADLAGHPITDLVIATRDTEGGWSRPRGIKRDAATKTLQVSSSHFSVWTAGWVKDFPQLYIHPNESTVTVGSSLTLVAMNVDPAKDNDLLAAPTPAPKPNAQPAPGDGESDDDLLAAPSICGYWAVNGKRGGDKDRGFIHGAEETDNATYVAPAKVPTPKQVTVSCEQRRGRAKMIAVAYVTIKDKASGWHGHVEYTYSESHQNSGPTGAGGTITKFGTESRTVKGEFDLVSDSMGWGGVSGVGNGNIQVVRTDGMRNPICSEDGGSSISGDAKVKAEGRAGSGAGTLSVNVNGESLSAEQHQTDNCSKQSKPQSSQWTGTWGTTCEFVGIDFDKGGSYEAQVPSDNGKGTCKLSISPK